MTEEEAKTKWCPAYRVSVAMSGLNIDHADNRGTIPNSDTSNCIASACMAWRIAWRGWDDKTAVIVGEHAPAGWIKEGYCGLAGNIL